MDEWLKQLQTTLDLAAQNSSEWLVEVSQKADQAIEEWVDSSLEVAQEIDQAIAPNLARLGDQIDSALDSGLLFFDEHVASWVEETAAPLTQTVTPWLQNHPTCVGCRNYHGAEYGEEMLVCGMHPYGPEDETCPDWESVWPTDSDEA
ncbi:hypothetical protein BH23CYA1_BH23CYA1_07410 [soil metagenome]